MEEVTTSELIIMLRDIGKTNSVSLAKRAVCNAAADRLQSYDDEIKRVSLFLATHSFPGYSFMEGDCDAKDNP